MPIQIYECPKCGHRIERFESMGARPGRPRCKYRFLIRTEGLPNLALPCTGRMKRVVGAMSFRFNCSMPTYQKEKR